MAKRGGGEGAQFVKWFGPLLRALRELGGSASPEEAVRRVAEIANISDEQQSELLASGQPRFRNQVNWARFYLSREGYLGASKRGVWSLSSKGLSADLTDGEARAIFLKWVEIDRLARQAKSTEEASRTDGAQEVERAEVQAETDLLATMLGLPAAGFERLSQRVLREAGFSEVEVTGRTGDGGIDGFGTLEINPLISFKVLFQCKRYKGSVGSPEVRNFRGAMQGRADKGLILTTGSFTADARKEAVRDGAPPIELVDGQKLVTLLESLELGVRPRTIFEVDQEFFDSFR